MSKKIREKIDPKLVIRTEPVKIMQGGGGSGFVILLIIAAMFVMAVMTK